MNDKTTTAILIDPFARTVTQIEAKGLREWYDAMKCDLVTTAAYINDKDDCILVDDEGLFKQGQRFFVWGDYPQPLAGRALIVGTDDEGETVSPSISIDDARAAVMFLDTGAAVEQYNKQVAARHAEAAIINARGGGAYVVVAAPTLEIDDDGNAVAG